MMELKVKEQKDNLFFNRKEVIAVIEHLNEPTPKRLEVKKLISEKLGAPEELIVIRKLKSQFGAKSVCEAMFYKSKEDLQRYEPAYVLGRESGHKTHHTKEQAG